MTENSPTGPRDYPSSPPLNRSSIIVSVPAVLPRPTSFPKNSCSRPATVPPCPRLPLSDRHPASPWSSTLALRHRGHRSSQRSQMVVELSGTRSFLTTTPDGVPAIAHLLRRQVLRLPLRIFTVASANLGIVERGQSVVRLPWPVSATQDHTTTRAWLVAPPFRLSACTAPSFKTYTESWCFPGCLHAPADWAAQRVPLTCRFISAVPNAILPKRNQKTSPLAHQIFQYPSRPGEMWEVLPRQWVAAGSTVVMQAPVFAIGARTSECPRHGRRQTETNWCPHSS